MKSIDASALALEANRFFVGNGDFYNLPRKFKVCITGCHVWCAYPEINDVGLTAIRRDGKIPRLASPCAWAAGSPPILIWRFA